MAVSRLMVMVLLGFAVPLTPGGALLPAYAQDDGGGYGDDGFGATADDAWAPAPGQTPADCTAAAPCPQELPALDSMGDPANTRIISNKDRTQ